MSGEQERRWDDAVETAWREFRQRLADRLAAMAEDEVLLVGLSGEADGESMPCCQALAGRGMLRVEALSNAHLAPEHMLDPTHVGLLEHLGFAAPGDDTSNHWAEVDQREADRAAVMIVRATREVHAVLHPVWLDAGGLEPQQVVAEVGTRRTLPPRPDRPRSLHSVDDVRHAVSHAVADLYDVTPEWDEDGDLPLPTEGRVVWVSVSSSSPRVLLHCALLDDVVDQGAALVEVNRLNRTEFGLTFFVRDQRVVVTRELGLDAVVPLALRAEFERLVCNVDEWARALAERVRTGAELQPDARRERFATCYGVMVELEREQRGSVGPATMAQIFENDTGLLLKAVRINERRRREARAKARAARDERRSRVERVARARQEYLRELTSRLRAALRLIVDAPVRKVQLDQLALFEEDECGTSHGC